jgi:MFS transporter, PPP family, 3-phenylpropionic acid transporter
LSLRNIESGIEKIQMNNAETDQTQAKKGLSPAWTGSLYYVFTFLAAGAYMPFIYVYFNELGLNGKQIGLISILSPVLTIMFSTLVASVADRTRKRVRITQIALGGAAVAIFMLRYPTNYSGVALLMFAFAIFSSPISALSDGLLSRMAQRNRLNYGGMRLWGSLAFAIASLSFGTLWGIFGFKPMFAVAAVFYIPLIWATGKVEEGPGAERKEHLPFTHLLQDRGTLLLLVASLLSGVSNSLFLIFGSIYMRSIGGTDFLIGLTIAIGALAELPMMFFNVRISKRLRKVNTVILSYFLMASAYLGYILTSDPNLLPLFTILKGLGYGLWFTVTIRILVERTPEEWAATAQSMLVICTYGLSPLLAGPLGGWIHDTIGPAAVFGLGVISLFLAAMVLWLASRRQKYD